MNAPAKVTSPTHFEPFEFGKHWPSLKVRLSQAHDPLSPQRVRLLADGPSYALVGEEGTLGLIGLCDFTIEGVGFFWVYLGDDIADALPALLKKARAMLDDNSSRWPAVAAFALKGDTEGYRLLRHLGFMETGTLTIQAAQEAERTYQEFRRSTVTKAGDTSQ